MPCHNCTNAKYVYYSGPSLEGIDTHNNDNLLEILEKINEKVLALQSCCAGTSTTTTTTTLVFYNTQLSFSTDSYNFKEGVSGQSINTNNILSLSFDKVDNPIGLYQSMTISIEGTPVLQVTYRQEYFNHQFKFTSPSGIVHYGNFGADINF